MGVLLAPGAAFGKVAEACCGIGTRDLDVTFDPDPSCVDQVVNISGSYNAYSTWIGPSDSYNTWVEIKIWDSSDNLALDVETNRIDGEPSVAPDPGVDYDYSYDWTPTMADTYTYEIIAQGYTTMYGTTLDIISGEITVEECCVADMALEQVIRDRLATECDPEVEYKSHGAYISCAAQIIDEYLEAGDITEEEASCFMNPIARSTVGMPDKSNKPGKK